MALAAPQYQPAQPHPRIANPRRARTATEVRIAKNSRARYNGLFRVAAGLGGIMFGLLFYVMLTSNVTSLNYSLANAQEKEQHLQEQTARLDDRLLRMTSDDRLARIAAQLNMHPSLEIAVVHIGPPSNIANARFPVLDKIAAWFSQGTRPSRVR
jgi:hypothetical protein